MKSKQDIVDEAADSFRDATERYNEAVRTYNKTAGEAYEQLLNAFFKDLEPAIVALSVAAKKIGLNKFAESLVDPEKPTESSGEGDIGKIFPKGPPSSMWLGETVIVEFEMLAADADES